MLDRLRADLTAACRALVRTPGTALAAVITLAMAAGLNLAMFGLTDRALLSPPAHISAPSEVYTVGFELDGLPGGATASGHMTTAPYPTFDLLRASAPLLQSAAAFQRIPTSVIVDDRQLSATAMLVSGDYFDLLGPRPLIGRQLLPADDARPAGQRVAVLSYGFWLRAFNGDPRALGRTVSVRGVDVAVIGVMPPGFNGHSAARTDVWVPIHAAMPSANWDTDRFRNITSIVVRLAPGVSSQAAAAQATSVAGRRISLWPVAGGDVTATERRMAWWLSGISALVLVIGLANTATLLLVRGAARRRDLAIRTTLGATRVRLAIQVLVEAALIAAAATGAAAITAAWLDDAVRRVLLPSIGDAAPIGIRVVLATAAAGLLAFLVSSATGLLLIPDGSGQADLATVIRRRPRRHLHTGLLILQTTLCVVLLTGAGLFGRSFYKLLSQDFGMRTDGVLLARFEPGSGASQQDELFASAIDRIRALPGIAAATAINTIPFTGFNVPPISVPGLADPPSVDGQLPFLVAATPALFDVLGLRVVEGRRFDQRDERGAPVVIVNETMAGTVWPGQPAIGKCIRIGFDPSFDPFAGGPPPQPASVPCREVVGVMRDVRQRSVIPAGHEDRLMQYLVPFSQVPAPPSGITPGPQVQGLLLRVDGDPTRSIMAVRQAIVGTRTDLPFLQIRPYAELLDRQMDPWRLATALLALFGALALSVAAVGLYAAFAHAVGERRHEMAVRLAVGANPGRVLVLVQREAAIVAAAGIVAGSTLAVLGGRSLSSMLVDTAPADPLVFALAAALMLSVSAAATFLPARTAARTDPTSLLRSE